MMSGSAFSFLERFDSVPEAERFGLVRGWLSEAPVEFSRELRRERPVLRTPEATLVARHEDVLDVLGHPDVFTVGLYAPKMGDFMLAQEEGASHRRDKSAMELMLTRDDIPRLRGLLGTWAAEALDASPERIEVVRHLSRGVPARLVVEYFGFRGPDTETILRWSYWCQYDNFHNHGFQARANSAEIHETANQCKQEMKQYVIDLLPRVAKELSQLPPPDDVVARLLRVKLPESLGFGPPQLVLNVMGLLIGAIETTAHAVTHALDQLLQRPVHLEAARERALGDDLEAFDGYVCEALRFAPIAAYMFRLSNRDYTLAPGTDREAMIPAGTTVLALTQSAMFDETVVEWPEEFRPDRRMRDTFHFGHGMHACAGRYIGGVMIPEIIRRILRHGLPRRAEGSAGELDYVGGPFPESLTVEF
jgi:cytochrome P450